jgi:hypothetical protein
MRFVITTGTGLREIVNERKDARSALECALTHMKRHRPNIRIFDEDGKSRSLNDLHRLADQESRHPSHG